MGRFIETGGTIGFWENFRPPIIPVIVSFLELFNLSAPTERFIIATIFTSLLLIFQTIIAKKIEPKITIWSLLLLLSAPIVLTLSTRLLTDLQSTVFILLATILLFSKKPALSGALTGIAILTKFPHIAYIPAFLLYFWHDTLLQRTKESFISSLQQSIKYIAGLALILAPYMIFQKIYFGSYLQFMISAQAIPKAIAAKIFPTLPTFYIYYLLATILIIPFFIIGTLNILKKYKTQKEEIFIFIATILMMGYLTTFPHHEDRFLIMVLPFITIIAGKGFTLLQEWTTRFHIQKIFTTITLIILIIMIGKGIITTTLTGGTYTPQEQEYYTTISQIQTKPGQYIIMAETDALALTKHKIQFLGGIQYARKEIERLKPNAKAFAWNNCTYQCATDDSYCHSEQEEFNKVLSTMTTSWNTTIGQCSLAIYPLK